MGPRESRTTKGWRHGALTHPRLPLGLAVLAMALCLPSLWAGFGIDDWWHRLELLDRQLVPRRGTTVFNMFRFLDGDPERTAQLMDRGVVPWWTWPELEAAFVRPVAELTHRLDYVLWPDSPWMMHLGNLLWFGLAVGLATHLYQRVMGRTWVAGVAALLFAIDDAHGPLMGWIANRNSVMAICFGLMAAIGHVRWRSRGSRSAVWVASGCLALGLLSSEATLGIVAYLFAYALVLDRGATRQRIGSLVPYVAVIAAWWLLRHHLGYAMAGNGLYVDPVAQPLRFAEAVIDRAPILLLSQWAQPPASLHIFMPPAAVTGLQLGGVLVGALLAWAVAGLWRKERLARFWSLGMVLSLLPICATFPHERLLMFVGLGGMGLAALLLASWADGTNVLGRWLRGPVVAIHGVLAPLLLVPTTWNTTLVAQIMEADSSRLPTAPEIETQTWVFVSSPIPFLQGYLPVLRRVHEQPAPARLRTLAPSITALRIHRPDAHTLVVRPRQGYLTAPLDSLYREPARPLRPGQQVRLSDCTVTILATTVDERPLEVSFRFDRELEDRSLAWFVHRDGAPAPFALPAVGQTVALDAEPLVPYRRLLEP
jgi:hypothetical protein